MERWLALCMPYQPENVSIIAREKHRKLRLLSIFAFFAILAVTLFTIVDVFSDLNEVIADLAMLAVFGGAIIYIRRGRLVLATLAIFLSILADLNIALALISSRHAIAVVWSWMPMVAIVVIGGLLLPAWGHALLCASCMISLAIAMFSREHDLAAFRGSDIVSFVLYGCITMAGLAIISALYAQTMDGAIREADRAYELDLAHKELALSHDELAASHDALARAYQQLEQLATVDPITGLLNHRAFSENLRRLVMQGVTLSLIFADLDHFKRINDNLGTSGRRLCAGACRAHARVMRASHTRCHRPLRRRRIRLALAGDGGTRCIDLCPITLPNGGRQPLSSRRRRCPADGEPGHSDDAGTRRHRR